MHERELEPEARRAAVGDRLAAETLHTALWPQWYAIALRLLRDPAVAEEIAQDTSVRVLRALPQFDFRATVRSWSYRIALNLVRDRQRAHGRQRREVSLNDARGEPAVTSDPITRIALADAIRRLSAEDAELIALRYDADLKFREIADLLEQPIATVATRLRRALALLAAHLDEPRTGMP